MAGRASSVIAFLFVCLFFTAGCRSESPTEGLRIGFGKANLSPAGIYDDPLRPQQASGDQYKREEKFAIADRVEGRWRPGSGGVRKLVDSIYVSAMYGEDGHGPWAIITLDETGPGFELVDHLKEPLVHQLGIAKERLLFLPSHGHATPPLGPDLYRKAVFQAVSQAKESRSEVEIAALDLETEGKKYVINRRVHVEGVGSCTVMFNDGCMVYDDYADATGHIRSWLKNMGADPEKHMEPGKKYITDGEIDDHLQALFIRDARTGEMKGSFLRFAAHAVIVSSKVTGGAVSGDFPGYLKRKIETELGGIALFGQGPCGDLRPLNREYSHAFARAYGERLAGEFIRKYRSLSWEPLKKVVYYAEPVSLPLSDSLFLSDDELKAGMDDVEARYDRESEPGKRRSLQDRFWRLYRAPGISRMVRPEWREKKQVNVHVLGIQMNDKALIALPGELFTATGKEIRDPFALKAPIVVSLANEYISYVPADHERVRGGYEPSVSVVEAGSPDLLVRAAHKILREIYGN